MAERARVGILISGRGSNMAALVEATDVADCPYEVVLVASNNPDAAGLGFAQARGIRTWAHSHKGMKRAAFDALVAAELEAAGAEWVALAGYMRMLSPEFVTRWSGRMLNIHPSLLPKYKGLDTHARALAAGDAVHGASVHLVTAELDDGPVLAQAEIPVLPGDTPDRLAERLLSVEHSLYPATLSATIRQARVSA